MDLMKMTLDRLRGRTLVVKKEVAGGSGRGGSEKRNKSLWWHCHPDLPLLEFFRRWIRRQRLFPAAAGQMNP
jgi:hypothetical protein